MTAAETIVRIVEFYGLAGMAVAALFLTIGIDRIDASARGSYMFRPLVAPGVVVLWPLVVLRWLALERGAVKTGTRQRPHRTAHARIWTVLALVLPVILLVLLVMRQTTPMDRPAVQISEDGERQ